MDNLKNIMCELYKDEDGQGMTEYALIIALIAIVVIAVLTAIGTNIEAKFQEIKNAL